MQEKVSANRPFHPGPRFLAALLMLLSGYGALAAAPKQMGKRVKGAAAACPFELRLFVAHGTRIWVELVNTSREPQVYLHDGFHQPCRLLLKSSRGTIKQPTDTRKIKKQSNALDADMYKTLEPGGRDTLQAEDFIPSAGDYELIWGPFHFLNLPPGKYRATVVWKSALDRWTDPQSGKTGHEKGVWMGEVKSKEIDVDLPGASR